MQKEPKEVTIAREYCLEKTKDFEVEDVYWVDSVDGSIDESGEDVCYECAKKKVRVLEEKYQRVMLVCGGVSGCENDTCSHCNDCEKLLSYSLTECGVESELDHFLDDKTEIDVDDVDECYHLLNVLESYDWYDKSQERILLLAKKINELKS